MSKYWGLECESAEEPLDIDKISSNPMSTILQSCTERCFFVVLVAWARKGKD